MGILTGLTAAQIGQLTATQIKSLTATDIAGLTAVQLPGWTGAELAQFTAAQLAGFSKAQIPYLTTAAIAGLTPTQIALLTTTQVSGLTTAQIAALSTAQVAALTAADIAALSPAQVAAVTAADIASLTTQSAALTAAGVALSTTRLTGLTAADVAALSVTQTAGLTAAQLASLSIAQVQALTAAQVGALTATQLGALTAAQIGALTTADIHALSTARVAGLTATQIAGLSAAQIGALSAAQLGSLSINYNSMLAILQADAVGGMTAAKFSALQALAAKFNVTGGIAVSAYVQQITDDVVLGNADNATWTGGAAKSVALGNMTGTSSQTQVSELIGKWFLGTDLPSSSVTMSGVPNFSVSYSAVSNPLFGSNGPSKSDINQGYLGDCFLLAPLAELASQDPSAVKSMITSNGNNTYSVCFTVDGKADYVTVDNKLANGGGLFNEGSNDWASLVEEAYTELQGGGAVTGDNFSYGNSFSSIANGGYPEMTLEEITGAATITDFDASGSSWSSYGYNGASLTIPGKTNGVILQSSKSGMTTSAVQAALVADLAAGDDLILSSYTNAVDKNGKTTLVADHAMAAYGFDSGTGMLEIYNPWGTWSGGGQYWDTTFEVSLSTLLADGDTISVATNAPATGGTSGDSSTATRTGTTDSASSAASLFVAASASLPPVSGSASSSLLGSLPQASTGFGLAAPVA